MKRLLGPRIDCHIPNHTSVSIQVLLVESPRQLAIKRIILCLTVQSTDLRHQITDPESILS